MIHANNPFDSTLEYFGIPDCTSTQQLIVFDEIALQTNNQRFQLWLLSTLAHLLAGPVLASFGFNEVQALRRAWAINDWAMDQARNKLEQIQKLRDDQVIVLHEWSGRWRPSSPRDHAACLVSEMVADAHDLESFVYNRLQTELAAGTLKGSQVNVEAIVDDARERCRHSLQDIARAVGQWRVLEHKHALLARVFHYLGNIRGWVKLAIGRFGELDGPRTKEAELSVEQVEMIVWGLRVGSFSQSSLVVPLREMEQGLEMLRRDEVERVLNQGQSGSRAEYGRAHEDADHARDGSQTRSSSTSTTS